MGEPEARFREDPIRMLRAVRFAVQLGFDLERNTGEALFACRDLLKHVSKDAVRSEFEKIITAENAGKGLKLLANLELMKYIVGEEISGSLNRHEAERFEGLTQGIDNTFQVRCV